MSNPIYALTDHDHTEEELAPWLAECGTGDPMVDGLVLTALDLFDMAGPARGGRSVPSPVWADRTELEADPWAGWTQVVGHTPVPTVTNAEGLWFCDTWTDGDGSMLLLSDNGSFAPVRP